MLLSSGIGRVAGVVAFVLATPLVARATETEPVVPLVLDPRPEAPPPPEAPSSAEPPSAAPEPSEPDPAEPPAHPPPIDLLPPLSLARAAGIEVPTAPSTSDPVRRAEARTDRELRRELRRDALRSTGADGYFHDLGRAMRRGIEVDPMELQADLFRGRSIPDMLVTELGRYGPAERPIEPRGTPLPESRIHDSLDPHARAYDEMFDYQNLLNGHVTWHRVEVRVLQNRVGEIFDVQLLSGSGLPTVDHAAMRAARSAVLDAPPPERVIEGRETISSDWAIEVGDVATQLGQVGCTEPTEATTGGCAIAGRGILRFRVQLLDVVDGMHPPELDPSEEPPRAPARGLDVPGAPL